MASSLFGKLKLRLVDWVLDRMHRPNRIDLAATVAPSAFLRATSLHGPVQVEDHARIYGAELSGQIRVGRRSSLWGPGIYVHAKGDPVEIGAFCSIARYVGVHGYFHDSRRLSTHYVGRNVLGRPLEEEVVSKGPIRIGHDVWLGVGVQVLSGVTIGDGAVLGAGSVVSRDIPPYAIAVGAPAQVVRYRFDEATIERIRASRWWEWSDEEIRERAELFSGPLDEERVGRWL
jgi:acetyltransferase-like isoleucine patch superfamily enzyme